jgi:hypothetical protein
MPLEAEHLATINEHFARAPWIFFSQQCYLSVETFVLVSDVWIDRNRAGGNETIHLENFHVLPILRDTGWSARSLRALPASDAGCSA